MKIYNVFEKSYICKMLLEPVQILLDMGIAIHLTAYDGFADSIVVYWNPVIMN